MEESVRLHYLEAMGIDVWVARRQSNIALQAVDVQSENVGYPQGHKSADDCMDAGVIAMSGTIAGQSEAHPDNLNISENLAIPETPERWASLRLAQPKEHSQDDQTWKHLQHEVSLCRACSLCETRTQTVFGVGNKRATWMLIGEAPGRDEDLQGEPFVGRAGQLLNEMIRAIGLQREQVYIANMLKCRPPNNRDPQAGEVAACHGFLQRQIGLIQPSIIVAVGRIAAQNLLNTTQPLAKLRGRQHRLEDRPLVVVHHPAYLLRSLTEKAKAWDDLQFALSVYQSLES